MNERLLFNPTTTQPQQSIPEPYALPPWRVLIIDDDPDVHALTEVVFRSYTFEQRPIAFISGFSGHDAKRLLRDYPETAVILLDVVMENDHAGLEAARYIRSELKNRLVRIILRTGQPGQAPESRVIDDYDINDYKEKSTLSHQSLVTAMTTSLRSYRDLHTIETTRQGLNRMIEGAAHFYEYSSLGDLAVGILTQLVALLQPLQPSDSSAASHCFAATTKKGSLNLYAGLGHFSEAIGQPVENVVSTEVLTLIQQALTNQESLFQGNHYCGFFTTRRGFQNLLYLQADRPLLPVDRELIRVFAIHIASAFENLFLTREVINTQKSVTFTLGEVIEARSGDTGKHVRRVAESSRLLATLAGLSGDACELLSLASPMHDLGKIGIPDHILNKPDKLTPDEWHLIREHTSIGARILGTSDQEVIRTGAIIAGQHHEKWDGSGYPAGLAGQKIHIFARITAIIDVFDALANKRPYKDAWPLEQIISLFRAESGRHFDPDLVALFLDHLDEFLEIQGAFQDGGDASGAP
ncbi:MAG: DUF3369 domain-containing protein [Magnetococcales bacterium]|nr:DUF3369 domain-containing protein [Magnetococcales bacterium]NGZ05896.1 DUF3369 domain-containing protein [Magnetococcales bacterium]